MRNYLSKLEKAVDNISFRPLLVFFLVSLAIILILFVIANFIISALLKGGLSFWSPSVSLCFYYISSFLLFFLSCFFSFLILRTGERTGKEKPAGRIVLLARKTITAISFSIFLFSLIALSCFLTSAINDQMDQYSEKISQKSGENDQNAAGSASGAQKSGKDQQILDYLNSNNSQNYLIEKGSADADGKEFYLYGVVEGNKGEKVLDIALPITDIERLSGFWYDGAKKLFIVSQYVYPESGDVLESDYFYMAARGYREGEGGVWIKDFDFPFDARRDGFSYSLAGFCPEAGRMILLSEYGDANITGGRIYYKDMDNAGGETAAKGEGEIKKFGGDFEGKENFLEYVGFAKNFVFFSDYDSVKGKISAISSINVASLEEEIFVDLEKVLPEENISSVNVAKGGSGLIIKSMSGKEYHFNISSRKFSDVLGKDLQAWRMYRNEKAGYSVKAPWNWVVQINKDNSLLSSRDYASSAIITAKEGDDGICGESLEIYFPITAEGPHNDLGKELEGGLKGLEAAFNEEGEGDEVSYLQIAGMNALARKTSPILPSEAGGGWCGALYSGKKIYIDLGDGRIAKASFFWYDNGSGVEKIFDTMISALKFSDK